MSDEVTLNASESGASTSPASTTPSAAPVPATAPSLPDDVIARIREQVTADLSAKFQADLEKVRTDAANQAKSVADKKRNEALRRANLLKEAEQDFAAEGVDSAVIGRVAKRMTDRIFYSADDPAPEPAHTTPPPAPAPAFDEDAWEVRVRKEARQQFGLKGPELLAFIENAKQIAGNDPQASEKWISLGRKQMLAMAEREKQEAAQAKKEAETAAMGKTLEGQPPLSPFPVGGQPPSGEYKAKPTLNDANDLADAITEKFFKNKR